MSEPVPNNEHRAAVNRANAAHSTGPRSPEGKANSKRNSFKHGLYASELVLPGESAAELDALRASLHKEHQPATQTEEILVNEIAEHFWRLRRMRMFEARGMQPDNFDYWFEHGLLALVARNMASAERGMHKAITALRRLQLDRGFVPSKTVKEEVSSADKPSQPDTEPEFVPEHPHPAGFVPLILDECDDELLADHPHCASFSPPSHENAA
jgi:hypothetical protein